MGRDAGLGIRQDYMSYRMQYVALVEGSDVLD